MTPDELVQLASDLEASAPPQGSPGAKFAAAVAAWLSGQAETLDESLGLCGASGLESARTRYLRARRDRHIRAAAARVPGPTPWRRAINLEVEIGIFLSRIWPRWQHLPAPPPEASELRRALFWAHKARRLPTTAKRLSDIIGMEINGDC